MLYRIAICGQTHPCHSHSIHCDWGVYRILQEEWRFWSQDYGSLPERRTYGTEGVVRNWVENLLQGGRLPVINGVITPINGLITGFAWGYNPHKWSGRGSPCRDGDLASIWWRFGGWINIDFFPLKDCGMKRMFATFKPMLVLVVYYSRYISSRNFLKKEIPRIVLQPAKSHRS